MTSTLDDTIWEWADRNNIDHTKLRVIVTVADIQTISQVTEILGDPLLIYIPGKREWYKKL